jgi:hypothetical protein
MIGKITAEIAGTQAEVAARYAKDLFRTGRDDVQVIGSMRQVDPA